LREGSSAKYLHRRNPLRVAVGRLVAVGSGTEPISTLPRPGQALAVGPWQLCQIWWGLGGLPSISPKAASRLPCHGRQRASISVPAARCVRVLPVNVSPEDRAQGMPGAGRTHGLPATKNAGGSNHRSAGQPAFPAQWVTTYSVLPGDRAFFATVTREFAHGLDPSIGQHRGIRTTRLRRPHDARFVDARLLRPPQPASRLVTIGRNVPLAEAGCGGEWNHF